MRMIKAWINKYILKVGSPTAAMLGYFYEWDYLSYLRRSKREKNRKKTHRR